MPDRKEYRARDVRGAEMDLRKPWQKYVFFGGLAGIVLFLLFLKLYYIASL